MNRLTRSLLLACLPVALCLAVGILLQVELGPLPLLLARADVGTALMLLGGLASLFLLVYVLAQEMNERRCQRSLESFSQEQDEAHRRFMRRLDHELKNPLTALRAALANLTDITHQEGQVRIVQDAEHQVGRLSRLVGDLRKLSELEERPLEELPVDVADLLQEVVETTQSRPDCAGRQVRLVVSQVPWPLPSVSGDRDLLGLAFYNLVDNALKFTGSEDTIEIRALEDGRALLVEVADTGSGISEEDLPKIFEELYRGANARSYEGSGLGLALVLRIVSRHGGTVAVRSRTTKPGGTVFSVRLPFTR